VYLHVTVSVHDEVRGATAGSAAPARAPRDDSEVENGKKHKFRRSGCLVLRPPVVSHVNSGTPHSAVNFKFPSGGTRGW
jgi:hypothetical protein